MSGPQQDGGDGAQPRKRGRSVPAVYGLVSLVLVVGAVTFALSTPPPSTPPLAAVAPAPQEQLDVERVEQSSQFGEGAGGEGDCVPGDPGCDAGAPPSTAEEQAAAAQGAGPEQGEPDVVETHAPGELRRCAQGPGGPRQTADPQSPPCMAEVFQGDNGGDTWRGVTATEIRFGYDASGDSGDVLAYNLERWVAHIHLHYELYGRTITLVPLDLSGDEEDPAVQKSHAEEVIDGDVFAVGSYPLFGAYQRHLADAGVVTFVEGRTIGLVEEEALGSLHPHVWSVHPSLEESFTAAGRLACDSLVGHPAQHGGDEVRDEPRRFGLLVESPNSKGMHYDPAVLRSALDGCGGDPVVERYEHGRSDIGVVLQKLRDAGVTTVACVCRTLDERYTEAADAIGYEPEWFLPGISDDRVFLRGGGPSSASNSGKHPRSQLAHTFGLAGTLRWPDRDAAGSQRLDQQFWYHAAREADPAYDRSAGIEAYYPQWYYGHYAQLLILASGIQWAGPDLTPETFGAALTGLRFPSPGVGQAPWYQPSVGFGSADHAFNSDFSAMWWRDPDDAGWESGTDNGEVCYLGGGTRFTAQTLPADADTKFFEPEAGCR